MIDYYVYYVHYRVASNYSTYIYTVCISKQNIARKKIRSPPDPDEQFSS